MRKPDTRERLIQAMNYYDQTDTTWQKCIDKFQLCNTYKYIPEDIRTNACVDCMKYLSHVRYKNQKAFHFILEEICGVKKDDTENANLFSIANISDKELVLELRRRGYTTTCKKVVEL